MKIQTDGLGGIGKHMWYYSPTYDEIHVSIDFWISGMLAPPPPTPPRPAEKQAAPPREKQALPRPAEIDKTCGAQRGKADCKFQD